MSRTAQAGQVLAAVEATRGMKRLCSTVLIMEAIVIGLSIPVALTVSHASPPAAGTAGAVLAVAAIVLGGLARRRPRWTLIGGSVLQLLVIAAGAVVSVMYFLGVLFAALWVLGIWLAYHHEGVIPGN